MTISCNDPWKKVQETNSQNKGNLTSDGEKGSRYIIPARHTKSAWGMRSQNGKTLASSGGVRRGKYKKKGGGHLSNFALF